VLYFAPGRGLAHPAQLFAPWPCEAPILRIPMSAHPQSPSPNRLPTIVRDSLELIPLATIVVDEQAKIVFANPFVRDLYGWDPIDLAGQGIEALVPERYREAHARLVAEYLKSPEARPLDTGYELRARRKDGTEVPIEVELKPLAMDDTIFVLAVFRDLSGEGEIEKALRVSERRYRLAARHTYDMIQEVNLAEDRMTYLGDVDGHFGYAPGEFTRTISGLVDYIHPEDLAEVERAIEGLYEGKTEWSARYRLRAADGSWRHILDQGTLIGFSDEGRPNEGVGAFQDLTEQVEREQKLEAALAELQEARDRLTEENIELREELREGQAHPDIVGESETWKHVMAQVHLVAKTDSTVLITGETGTGKELLARALHAESGRSDKRLIVVNCATLPGTLIESELFGHEKGAFSGADRLRRGRFELADGGTLVLDEIGELPLDLQPKLLHVLQTGEFQRVGSSQTLDADARVIAATNRDLPKAVETGRFRSDLFYRLAVFPIEVPPLRRRRDDIELLTAYFLSRHNAKHGKSIETIPRRTLNALLSYEWPGNARELENLIERAVIVTQGKVLQLDPAYLRAAPGPPGADRGLSRGPEATGPSLPTGVVNLEQVEREHIVAVLDSCDWKVKGRGNAAEQLGLKESTLRSRMKRLGIERP